VAIIPAAEHGHVDIIRYLLDETRIDVNHVNNLGWTALIEAILLNDGGAVQQEVIRLLITGGADANLPDAEGVSPLAHARQRRFAEIEQILIEVGAQP
jgi:ankyrin repeat protein